MQETQNDADAILLDGPTVAQRIGTSTFYVRKHLTPVKLGPRMLRYRLSDVLAFIAAKAKKS